VTAVTPGGRALDAALTEWGRIVREPTTGDARGAASIDAYIRSPQGLGWPSADVLRPGERRAYTRNGQFEWCGAFVAWCWGAAGLDAEVRRLRLASTYRLGSAESRHGAPLLAVGLDELEPGDVLVVGKGAKGHRWGDHIVLVQSVGAAGDLAYTVEGNARGRLGDATIGEGVIVRTRPLGLGRGPSRCSISGLRQTMHAVRAFRPAPVMIAAAQ
jgi:hypothetical protein